MMNLNPWAAVSVLLNFIAIDTVAWYQLAEIKWVWEWRCRSLWFYHQAPASQILSLLSWFVRRHIRPIDFRMKRSLSVLLKSYYQMLRAVCLNRSSIFRTICGNSCKSRNCGHVWSVKRCFIGFKWPGLVPLREPCTDWFRLCVESFILCQVLTQKILKTVVKKICTNTVPCWLPCL